MFYAKLAHYTLNSSQSYIFARAERRDYITPLIGVYTRSGEHYSINSPAIPAMRAKEDAPSRPAALSTAVDVEVDAGNA